MSSLTLDELNYRIKQFGDRQKAFMRSENRALLRSVLFDVPRRSSIGWYCYYDRAPALLRSLVEQISPEEIGRRMRRLCSRPYYLQLSILMCSYFGARQQLLLDHGLGQGGYSPAKRWQMLASSSTSGNAPAGRTAPTACYCPTRTTAPSPSCPRMISNT